MKANELRSKYATESSIFLPSLSLSLSLSISLSLSLSLSLPWFLVFVIRRVTQISNLFSQCANIAEMDPVLFLSNWNINNR